MATRLGRGHCGAHLTLLFTVEDESDEPEFQGSIGSGICLEHGVEACLLYTSAAADDLH